MIAITADILADAKTLWRFHKIDTHLHPADAIVGLGSYDLRVADQAATLFHNKLAPLVIFTGARGNWTNGLAGTEADLFAERAIVLGVPNTAIVRERTATNIGENIRLTAGLLPASPHCIFVTKPQTTRRCLATVQKQWPDCHAHICCPQTSFEEQPMSDHTLTDLINEMVGDLWRLLTYPAKGFQVPVSIPPTVLRAYNQLRAAGFTGHIPSDHAG
jgi:uncharacterized SAM-binding protein YcdF (DUF218 family)